MVGRREVEGEKWRGQRRGDRSGERSCWSVWGWVEGALEGERYWCLLGRLWR